MTSNQKTEFCVGSDKPQSGYGSMDIVGNIDRFLAASSPTAAVRSRMTKARDEIMRLRQCSSQAMLQFVLANGVPMCREGKYRYHGVSEPIWHDSQEAAIQAAMREFHTQPLGG